MSLPLVIVVAFTALCGLVAVLAVALGKDGLATLFIFCASASLMLTLALLFYDYSGGSIG